jgi:hypothetical protein
MKTFGSLLALLGLLLVVLALPGQENAPLPRFSDRRAPAPTPRRSIDPDPGRGLITMDGGDTCTSPPAIAALDFNDSGTTIGKVDNSTGHLMPSCADTSGSWDRSFEVRGSTLRKRT